MSNVGALQQVVDYLRAHPEKHNQGEWVCGTTGCIAGWAVALANLTDISSYCPVLGELWLTVNFRREGQRLLGLTDDEAFALFMRTSEVEHSEEAALDLADALIARDKDNGSLTEPMRRLLLSHGLSEWPVTR